MSRIVTVSTIQLPAWQEGETPEAIKANNIKNSCKMLDIAGQRNSDIAVWGEYSNVRGIKWNGEGGHQFVDTVPGPLVEQFGEIARKYSMNLVAPIVGLCDGIPRNVALIINRAGELVGQYYKVHLPAPEAEWGLVAGDDIPVFELDFGKIGVMTCMFHFAKSCDRTLAVMASRRPEVYGELVKQCYQEDALTRAEKEYLYL